MEISGLEPEITKCKFAVLPIKLYPQEKINYPLIFPLRPAFTLAHSANVRGLEFILILNSCVLHLTLRASISTLTVL